MGIDVFGYSATEGTYLYTSDSSPVSSEITDAIEHTFGCENPGTNCVHLYVSGTPIFPIWMPHVWPDLVCEYKNKKMTTLQADIVSVIFSNTKNLNYSEVHECISVLN